MAHRCAADRQLALAHSQRLAHITGVNWFFTALAAHARQSGDGTELREWLNETATAAWLLARVHVVTYLQDSMPRPDSLGIWAEHGQHATFMLEYDTGSEHLPQLTGKLPGYGRLAQAMAEAGHVCPLLLFCFATARREQVARRALAACYDAPALRIATSGLNPEQTSPARSVWLPLRRADGMIGQVALSALDAALPDPWHQYRAEQEQARQQAVQAQRGAIDPGDGIDQPDVLDDSDEFLPD